MTNIITNPAADPHDYEPTSEDARTMAGAQMAIVNGIGYDPWASKLLAANPSSGRTVLTVGDLLGLKEGDNPHQWYSPVSVQKVIEQITADYKQADPGHASYFDAQQHRFETVGLARYHSLISQIRSRYAGTPVGASESIFAALAPVPRPEALDPDRVPRRYLRGHRPDRRRQGNDRQPDRRHARSRSGSTTARTRPLTCSV